MPDASHKWSPDDRTRFVRAERLIRSPNIAETHAFPQASAEEAPTNRQSLHFAEAKRLATDGAPHYNSQ
jgi:hypothetical protein